MKFERSVANVVSGLLIIILMVGSMFSRHLLRYGYFIIIAFSLLMYYFFTGILNENFKKKFLGKFIGAIGFFGIFLIFLFFGIQSPQIPFKNYVLVIGIAVALYGLIGLRKAN